MTRSGTSLAHPSAKRAKARVRRRTAHLAQRRSRWAAAILLALLALLALPAAQAADPVEFRNAQPTTFGAVTMEPYMPAPAGEQVQLRVPITLHPGVLREPAARYIVGLDAQGEQASVAIDSLTVNGKPVLPERIDSDTRQPRIVLPGDALPREGDVELLLTGHATVSADGQVHVGALAMAFDASWGTLRARDSSSAQAYGFTLLMATGHTTSGMEPRFAGQGNSVLALAPLAALVAVAWVGLRAASQRLAPQPTPAPTPPAIRPAVRAPATTFTPAPARPAPFVPGPARPTQVEFSTHVESPMHVEFPSRPPAQRVPLPRGPRPVAVRRRKVPKPEPLAEAESPVLARTPARRPPRTR